MTLADTPHAIPANAPSAFVTWRDPPAAQVDLVLFLHGWRGCASVLALAGATRCEPSSPNEEGWGLIPAFQRTLSEQVFILPQLAWLRRTGAPGRLREPGFATSWIEAIVNEAARQGGAKAPRLGRWTLVAHSAGFESALALIRHDDPPIDTVVLMDALYAGEAIFEQWVLARPERRLVLLFTGHGTTAQKSLRLGRRLRSTLGAEAVSEERMERFSEVVGRYRVAILRTNTQHGQIPSVHLEEIINGLGQTRERSTGTKETPR